MESREVQDKLFLNQNCLNLISSQLRLLVKQVKLLDFQEMYWKLKAKSNHLKLSDANTKYYHACTSIRRNRNIITYIKNEQEVNLTDPKQVEDCFTNAFIKRFKSNPTCWFNEEDFCLLDPIISNEENQFL